MLMFTLAISCLTNPSLPWFMHLTSGFLCNVALYSIRLYFHHQTHTEVGVVSSSTRLFITSGAISPLWPEFTFQCHIFCLFILFMGFSKQEWRSGLPFPSPVNHGLSELSTMTHPSWVTLHSMAHNFVELNKVVIHVIGVVSFLWSGKSIEVFVSEISRFKPGLNHQQENVQFSHSVMSDSLRPHGLEHARLPCPSPTPGACSNSCPSSQWCHQTISSSVVPFSSCPQSLSASGSFPMSQLFTWGGQSIGVSASALVLSMSIQDFL